MTDVADRPRSPRWRADLRALDARRVGSVRGGVRAAQPSPGQRLGCHQAAQRLDGACAWPRTAAAGPVGGQLLITRPRGLPWGMGYLPRGPVTPRPLDGAALDIFTARVREAARGARLGWVRMEPEVADTPALRAALERSGWVPAPHVQPERTRIIDLTQDEAAILAAMHRKCRQSIHKSERLGVRVVESGDGASGPSSMPSTPTRCGAPASRPAARRPTGTCGMSWRRGAWRGCCSRRTRATGQSVATLFLVTCGSRAVDLYGGTTAEGGRLRANYLLKWEAIRRSRDAGLRGYDLWGLPRAGIAQFKSGFGGAEVDYIGAWDLVTDRVGHAVLRLGETGDSGIGAGVTATSTGPTPPTPPRRRG